MKGETVQEGTYYLPTYLRSDDTDEAESLLIVRHFTQRRGPKTGKLRTLIATEVITFPDDDAMVEAIEGGGWEELPAEADGNPDFLPEEYRGSDHVWRTRALPARGAER